MSISFLVIDVVQTSVVYVVEAARIAFAQPSANFLDEKASGRLGMPVRIGKQRKRLTRSQRVARRQNIHENTTTHDGKFLVAEFDMQMRRYLNHNAHMVRLHMFPMLLKRAYLGVYDWFRRKLNNSENIVSGPISIYTIGFLPLLVRYAAHRPHEVDWSFALRARNGSSDLLFMFGKQRAYCHTNTIRSGSAAHHQPICAKPGWLSHISSLLS